MQTALLETKLYVPRSRSGLVRRPRLSERLGRGSASRLTLVSAPAGFGKTTLLTEWLTARSAEARNGGDLTAWLSLDRGDNDPASFWSYVIAALNKAVPEVGDNALALLRSPQPPPIEAVLTTLLNDMGSIAGDVVLVLDDYHVIDAHEIQTGLAFLLDNLPPSLHMVISSRADPPLPLSRLRARGDLVEIRAADLRFTAQEAASYLNEMMGLQLTVTDVAALESRTEGWIAALQLAALSMQGRDDVAGFIAGFAGDDRYVVDYLVEEVLARQSEQVQTFLLQTSILSRLSGPLCDAVTGQSGGKAMLATLERGNLFLVALDDRRQWHRYHHLFADVLNARLQDEQPDQVPDLHRRASEWYEQNGERTVAIDHALAAHDFARAADLVELAIPSLAMVRQEGLVRRWLDMLPDEVVRVRPVLAMGLVGALMAGNEFEGIEGRLRDVERWLEPNADHEGAWNPPAGMVVADQRELARLPGEIEMYRTGLALVRGDLPATISHAQRAIDLAADDDHLTRSGASALAGLAFWAGGDLDAAHRGYSVCVEGLQRAGHIADVLGCSITLADIRSTQGRLRDAMHTYEWALKLASDESVAALRGTADMYVGMSRIACERDDLSAANEYLQRAKELGEHTWLPQNPYRWRVAMARIREIEGDLSSALTLLEEAQQVYVGDFSPNVRPVSASRARVLIGQGELGAALAWARQQELSAEDDLSYLREYEHITLARLLLARAGTERSGNTLQDASRLLSRLLQAAEQGGRAGSVIEILVLTAIAQQALGNPSAAIASLERALMLAEPEGYVRVFVDEGLPIAALLKVCATRGFAQAYVRRLLASASRSERERPVEQALIDPLSERELDVLRLLATDLDGPAIARELVVSLNTVRTHTKNIYRKLDVTNRRSAITVAAQLNLLSLSRSRNS